MVRPSELAARDVSCPDIAGTFSALRAAGFPAGGQGEGVEPGGAVTATRSGRGHEGRAVAGGRDRLPGRPVRCGHRSLDVPGSRGLHHQPRGTAAIVWLHDHERRRPGYGRDDRGGRGTAQQVRHRDHAPDHRGDGRGRRQRRERAPSRPAADGAGPAPSRCRRQNRGRPHPLRAHRLRRLVIGVPQQVLDPAHFSSSNCPARAARARAAVDETVPLVTPRIPAISCSLRSR